MKRSFLAFIFKTPTQADVSLAFFTNKQYTYGMFAYRTMQQYHMIRKNALKKELPNKYVMCQDKFKLFWVNFRS